jgi:hypothetical protein
MFTSLLPYYLQIFENEVSVIYEKNENSFDPESYHGRFHILRCLFLAERIIKYYHNSAIKIDQKMVYMSIMFHDIAREGNGTDIWEEYSMESCFDFMTDNGFSIASAQNTCKLILKDEPLSAEGQILYDADVLDYNRFFPVGYFNNYFKEHKLKFGTTCDTTGFIDLKARLELILYAQNLVKDTEQISVSTPTTQLIQIFKSIAYKFEPS